MSVIKTIDLNYIYGKNTPFEVQALKNINIEIQKGDLVGIIGHTGSGKSTLIQLLNGLNKPSSGQVLLNDIDISSKDTKIRDVRFKVGMVFQYPEYQLFEETIYKDIAFGPKNMGLDSNEVDKRVKEAAQAVNISEEMLKKSPFDLSGGEKRRAAIAGVIAMRPEVLILDEPTAGLDPKGRQVVLNLIKNYHNNNQNTTVIFVSHTMEEVATISNKVIVMNKSEVAMYDETYKVFRQSEKLSEIGLELPQITKIMLLLKEKGFDLPQGILTVDEAVTKIMELSTNKK